ncbi:MAG: ABC transporter ATP-binding protein [Tannerellaceae bacterium]|jgi:ABC-2 type transport system ATP-binding protein|nr:ABC transporter ATP-binding protein [Tannerellaceae bacterium]
MFTIENLHAGYGTGKEVLKGLSLSMETGTIQGFVGLNGAGKTTFLNTLYQFIRPSEGRISYRNAPLRRTDISYLEATNYFYPYMTGREYLRFFPAGEAGFDTESWMQLFALPPDEITETYSTGMKKKLALLAALKPDKPLLILDEPFNGLDIESVHLLSMILDQLRTRKKTLLITSHLYESLSGCCDYIHYLSGGVIARSYPAGEFSVLRGELQGMMEERFGHSVNELLPDAR